MVYNAGMATVIRTEERNGETIAIYESGAEYNTVTNRLVKAPPRAAITPENSNEYKRKRQEKAAAALRARIVASTQKRSDVKLTGAADAVAEAGGYIWDEVVLGEDVYPRDRLEAWEKLSKYAQVLPSDIKAQAQDPAQALAAAAGVGAAMALQIKRVLDDVLRREVVDSGEDRTDEG